MLFKPKDSLTLFVVPALFLWLCSQLTGAEKVDFKDCGSKEGKIFSLDISPCPEQPCVFHKNTNVTLAVTFETNEIVEDSVNTKIDFSAYFAGIHVHLPLANPKACVKHGLKCPLKPKQKAVMTAKIFIKDSFPPVKLIAELDMTDQKNLMVFCLQIPVAIEAKELTEQTEEP